MSPYKKHIRFFIVLFLFTAIVAGLRIYWISKALPSKATVLYIGHTRNMRHMQFYPVVTYQTVSGQVETSGTYNLPIDPGQVVDILYNPDDSKEFRLHTNYWLWYDIWSWYRLIWVVIAIYYVVLFIVNKNTVASRNAIKVTTNNSRKNIRLPRVVKALLFLLLPITVFLVGQIWDVPYAKQISLVILVVYVAVGSSLGSAPNGD